MKTLVSEDRMLLIGSALMIVTPFLLAGYAYWFLSTTYAQQRAVEASLNWSRAIDAEARAVKANP